MMPPQLGIHSTQHKDAPEPIAAPTPTNPALYNNKSTNCLIFDVQPFLATNANVIEDKDTSSDANIFCFATFADKQTGIIYNDLTKTFPFMSLKGNVCFLIVYHYEMNAILALPIAGFSDSINFAAYQQQYNLLKSKVYKIHLNVMDNQAFSFGEEKLVAP
jgi:hypothetical protein